MRETLQCHTAVEWAIYAAVQSGRTPSLHLDAGVLPCCHCAVEVGEENGLEEWKKEAEQDAKVNVSSFVQSPDSLYCMCSDMLLI